MNLDQLIDRIYEAANEAEIWREVLDLLAKIAGAEGAILFLAPGNDVTRAVASHGFMDKMTAYLSIECAGENERLKGLLHFNHNQFLTDLDMFRPEELEGIPYYRDLLRPLGLGWCAATIFETPLGDSMVLSVERALSSGPIDRPSLETLDRLRPHLARSCALSTRACLANARSSVEMLEAIGFPAIALTKDGRVLAQSSLFDDRISGAVIGQGDILKFRHRPTQDRFSNILNAVESVGPSPTTGSFILGGEALDQPGIAQLLPMKSSHGNIFTGATALLFITPISDQSTKPVELLQSLYDLTPAEAKLAKLIGDGHTIATASVLLAIQESTTRVHLKSIFHKTGVKRQSELVRLALMPTLKSLNQASSS